MKVGSQEDRGKGELPIDRQSLQVPDWTTSASRISTISLLTVG